MGDEARSRGIWLLPPAHEDEMGQLQLPSTQRSPQYRVGEKAKRPPRICHPARIGPSYRTETQRTLRITDDRVLSGMAGGTC